MSDVKCPYCNADQIINPDDGAEYVEEVLHQQDCDNCNKTFVFMTSVTYCYEARKADCLNGADHKYARTFTIPVAFTLMQCTACEDRRQPTKDEMKLIMDEGDQKHQEHKL